MKIVMKDGSIVELDPRNMHRIYFKGYGEESDFHTTWKIIDKEEHDKQEGRNE